MDQPKQHTVEERIKILEACQKRWQECGETECAAIYQGAAFELKLVQERVAQLEGFKVVLDGICEIVTEFPNTNENVTVVVRRIKQERDNLTSLLAKRDEVLGVALEALELFKPVRDQILSRTKTTEAFDSAYQQLKDLNL